MDLNEIKFVHMLGVNGISMSGLAEILLSRGIRLSGSDLTSSSRTDRLTQMGATIYYGNSADNIKPVDLPDLLVYTAAAGPENPERVAAAKYGVRSVDRAELLGVIMAGHKKSIGVAGTHGKTTTTSMLASICVACGMDATINVGGELDLIGGNSRIGGSELFLAEACEYTDSFLKLRPWVAVITNVEYDHSDYFRDFSHMLSSFARFAGQASAIVVINADDEGAQAVRIRLAKDMRARLTEAVKTRMVYRSTRWVTFGVKAQDADFTAQYIDYDENNNASFIIVSRNVEFSARIRLRVPGLHNVYNALAAAATAMSAGCRLESVITGLERFEGVKKRFEYKGAVGGYNIVDDYAHHPTEVRCTLETARKYARAGRVICVFQPHTYTRTRTFLKEFAEAFTLADYTLLADIYPAREKDPGDISSSMLADAIKLAGGDAAYFSGGFSEIARWIRVNAAAGDLVLTMGAGLASIVADILLSR